MGPLGPGPQASGGPKQPMCYFSSREIIGYKNLWDPSEKSEGDYDGKDLRKKVSFSPEWNWDGVMHSESGGDDDDVDDDELVRERRDDS